MHGAGRDKIRELGVGELPAHDVLDQGEHLCAVEDFARHLLLDDIDALRARRGDDRYDLAFDRFRAPQFGTVRGGIGHHPRQAQGEDLRLARRLDDDGSGPGCADRTRLLPEQFAGAPVENEDLGFTRLLLPLVELHDHLVLPAREGCRVAVRIVNRAKVL